LLKLHGRQKSWRLPHLGGLFKGVGQQQIEGFPATAAFIVHFNKQMNGDSSLSPLIVYPTVDGKTTWDSSFTTLTLRPELPLEAGNTYVFFLDPRLSSMSGETFSTSPQWTIKVAFGPRVLNSEISPNEKKQPLHLIGP